MLAQGQVPVPVLELLQLVAVQALAQALAQGPGLVPEPGLGPVLALVLEPVLALALEQVLALALEQVLGPVLVPELALALGPVPEWFAERHSHPTQMPSTPPLKKLLKFW